MEENKVSRELTEQEWELVQAIRNYKKAYPNGAKRLIAYVMQVLDELLYD